MPPSSPISSGRAAIAPRASSGGRIGWNIVPSLVAGAAKSFGVGLLPMLDIDIAASRLMTPLPQITVPRTGFVAIIPRQADPGGLAAGFVDWLAAEKRGGGPPPRSVR
jgi:hypothetical protein